MATMLANEARPKSDATITVRIIKSFEFRTERSLVLHNINLEAVTVGQLKEIAHQGITTLMKARLSSVPSVAIQSQNGWKAYRNVQLGVTQRRQCAAQ